MFTGLIESIGEVVDLAPAGEGRRLRLATALASELSPGDSLAVDGVCLTVTSRETDEVTADVGPETLRVSTLGDLAVGVRVNLERSLRANGRLGGHFVLGHVDGMGRVEAIRSEGEAHWLAVTFPEALSPLLVPKGSVAVSGISLTVAGFSDGRMNIMIVPFSWSHTTASAWRVGHMVNLEMDVIGKYVARALAVRGLSGAVEGEDG
jgi:riboflavin synthase